MLDADRGSHAPVHHMTAASGDSPKSLITYWDGLLRWHVEDGGRVACLAPLFTLTFLPGTKQAHDSTRLASHDGTVHWYADGGLVEQYEEVGILVVDKPPPSC